MTHTVMAMRVDRAARCNEASHLGEERQEDHGGKTLHHQAQAARHADHRREPIQHQDGDDTGNADKQARLTARRQQAQQFQRAENGKREHHDEQEREERRKNRSASSIAAVKATRMVPTIRRARSIGVLSGGPGEAAEAAGAAGVIAQCLVQRRFRKIRPALVASPTTPRTRFAREGNYSRASRRPCGSASRGPACPRCTGRSLISSSSMASGSKSPARTLLRQRSRHASTISCRQP